MSIVTGAPCPNCKTAPCRCVVEVTSIAGDTITGFDAVPAGASFIGESCVNCHTEPCTCITEILDRRGVDRGRLRRFHFPDGSILNVATIDEARARAAGGAPVE